TPDALGNFTGNPAFVFPIDPRPNADGPTAFNTGANFDLQASSKAIDAANPTSSADPANILAAPATDFLGRGRVRIAGKGFPGTGPADVGAFEYKGTGGRASALSIKQAASSLTAAKATTTPVTISALGSRAKPVSTFKAGLSAAPFTPPPAPAPTT